LVDIRKFDLRNS